MINNRWFFLISVLLFAGCLAQNWTPVHTTIDCFYSSLLGTENASDDYRKLVLQALQDFGHTDTQKIQIRQMNSVASRLLGQDFLSFTLTNIWLNETALNTLKETERMLIIYHEVAHFVEQHHMQLLQKISIPVTVSLASCIAIAHLKLASYTKKITQGLLAAASIIALDHFIIHPTVIQQEKEADILAAKTLIQINKKDVIQKYIQLLKKLSQNGKGSSTDGWHPTIDEQIQYMQPLLG